MITRRQTRTHTPALTAAFVYPNRSLKTLETAPLNTFRRSFLMNRFGLARRESCLIYWWTIGRGDISDSCANERETTRAAKE